MCPLLGEADRGKEQWSSLSKSTTLLCTSGQAIVLSSTLCMLGLQCPERGIPSPQDKFLPKLYGNDYGMGGA